MTLGAGISAGALQGLQQVVQIALADADVVVAGAMLPGQISQLPAVEARQHDAPFVIAQKAALGQRYRGTGAGADAEDGQL